MYTQLLTVHTTIHIQTAMDGWQMKMNLIQNNVLSIKYIRQGKYGCISETVVEVRAYYYVQE